LKALLDKKLPENFDHITKLKDLKQINFESNPDNSEFPFICPFSKIEFNGMNRFVCLWSCGCVFSEKLLLNVKSVEKKCPVCNLGYSALDVVSLNLTSEEQAELK